MEPVPAGLSPVAFFIQHVYRFPRQTAQAVAQYLGRLGAGPVALYGCGSLSKVLLEHHPEVLAGCGAWFLDSEAGPGETFGGFPKRPPAALMDHPASRVLVMSLYAEAQMRAALAGLFQGPVDGLGEALLTAEPEFLGAFARDILQQVCREHAERARARLSSPRRIAIVCPVIIVKVLRLSRALKARGFDVILIAANPCLQGLDGFPIGELEDRGWFDLFFCFPHLFASMTVQLLEDAGIELVHLITSVCSAQPLAHIVKCAPCPVFTEYDDILELCFEDPGQYQKFCNVPRERMAEEAAALATVFKESAGLVSRHSPRAMDLLVRKYGCQPDWIPFAPYPLANASPRPARPLGEPIRIVYAGCLASSPDANNYPEFQSFLEIGRILDSQGISFTIFNGTDKNGQGFEDFIRLDQECPLFSYRFGMMEDELMEKLREFDFGWHVFDYSGTRNNPLYNALGLSTKLFFYLDAGLPVMVSPEISFECETAVSQGFGLEIAFTDVPRLRDILSGVDYPALKARALELREEWSMERQLPRLLGLYASGIARRSART